MWHDEVKNGKNAECWMCIGCDFSTDHTSTLYTVLVNMCSLY